jgi:hypothetical protein
LGSGGGAFRILVANLVEARAVRCDKRSVEVEDHPDLLANLTGRECSASMTAHKRRDMESVKLQAKDPPISFWSRGKDACQGHHHK